MWKVSDDIRKGMKNAAETIMAAESVYIFSHIVADGDALGSCAALCHALRRSCAPSPASSSAKPAR